MFHYIEFDSYIRSLTNYCSEVKRIVMWSEKGSTFDTDDIFYSLTTDIPLMNRGEDYWNVPLLF